MSHILGAQDLLHLVKLLTRVVLDHSQFVKFPELGHFILVLGEDEPLVIHLMLVNDFRLPLNLHYLIRFNNTLAATVTKGFLSDVLLLAARVWNLEEIQG